MNAGKFRLLVDRDFEQVCPACGNLIVFCLDSDRTTCESCGAAVRRSEGIAYAIAEDNE